MFLSKMLHFEHYVGYNSDIWKKCLLGTAFEFILFFSCVYTGPFFECMEKQYIISPIKLFCVLYWTQKYITEWSFLSNIFITLLSTYDHLAKKVLPV